MMTATFGGILRDLLSGEPSVLMRPEIYVSAALLGSAVFIAASMLGAPLILGSALGVIAAFALRGGAIRYWLGLLALPLTRRPPARRRDVSKRSRSQGSDDDPGSLAANRSGEVRLRAASLSESCGRGPICWITRPAARLPSRPQTSSGLPLA
jgi:hypothetical protein